MIQIQEKAPGESKGLVNLATTSISATIDQATANALVTGVHVVVVETAEGRYRRRVYMSLDSARKAADRANMSGHRSRLVLCQLIPASAGDAL